MHDAVHAKREHPVRTYLLLKRKDMADASVNGILHPRLSLVSDAHHRLAPVGGPNVEQHLGDVARSEHLVDRREPCGALLRVEVGSEDAVRGALAPQKLARAARRPGPGGHGSRSMIAAIQHTYQNRH